MTTSEKAIRLAIVDYLIARDEDSESKVNIRDEEYLKTIVPYLSNKIVERAMIARKSNPRL